MTMTPTQFAVVTYFDGGPVPTCRVTEASYEACRRRGWIVSTDTFPFHQTTDEGREALKRNRERMTNQRNNDIDILARAIRDVEEVRADLRGLYGVGPDEPLPPQLDGGRDAKLAQVAADLRVIHGRKLVDAVPAWAAGNSGPGPKVADEPVIYLTDEDRVGRPADEQ